MGAALPTCTLGMVLGTVHQPEGFISSALAEMQGWDVGLGRTALPLLGPGSVPSQTL